MADGSIQAALSPGLYGLTAARAARSSASADSASATARAVRAPCLASAPRPPNESGLATPAASPTCRTRSQEGARGDARWDGNTPNRTRRTSTSSMDGPWYPGSRSQYASSIAVRDGEEGQGDDTY